MKSNTRHLISIFSIQNNQEQSGILSLLFFGTVPSSSFFVSGLSNKDVTEHRHGNRGLKIRLSALESNNRWETWAKTKKLPLCSCYHDFKTTKCSKSLSTYGWIHKYWHPSREWCSLQAAIFLLKDLQMVLTSFLIRTSFCKLKYYFHSRTYYKRLSI